MFKPGTNPNFLYTKHQPADWVLYWYY